MNSPAENINLGKNEYGIPLQLCPSCQNQIGALPGGRDAVCSNCGYKDPCCE